MDSPRFECSPTTIAMNTNSALSLLFALILILSLSQCKRQEIIPIVDDDDIINTDPVLTMDQIKVGHDFNWSNSNSGNLEVTMKSAPEIETEGETVLLVDRDQNIISKAIVKSHRAYFLIKTPIENSDFSLVYPNTGISKPLSVLNGYTDFYIETPPRDSATASPFKYAPKVKKDFRFFKPSTINSKGLNLIQNPYFDQNNLIRNSNNYNKLRTPGNWYYRFGKNIGTSTVNGNKVFTNTRNSSQVIAQSVAVQPTTEYNVRLYYSGSLSLYLDEFNNSNSWVTDNSITTHYNNNSASKNIITSSTTAYLQLYFTMAKSSYIDSIVVEEVPSIVDADGDGVADSQDDYPNDATKVYRIMYPTTGYQTLSFEDLWPSKGDYDFNDIIISAKTEYATNASGDYVWAKCNLSLDACGSSLPSGLGVHFLKSDNTAYTTQKLSSVTGDATIESNVNNCAIVYTNHFDEQTTYYTNTGSGHNATPEVFNFEVFFDNTKSNAPVTYMADFFYFRTDDRTHEIHLSSFPPTSKANTALFGTYDDEPGYTYSTENGLPWGMEVVTANKTFKHPKEKKPIVTAYSQFGQWANSKGMNYKTWHNNWDNAYVYSWSKK